jgi:uncharacterized MAPEG superfamily protein
MDVFLQPLSALLASVPRVNAAHAILLALFLAYLPHWIRVFACVRPALAGAGAGYDVRYTRESVARATDLKTETGRTIARLSGAHQNGLEAFAAFAAAVCLALVTKRMPTADLDSAATAFLALRLLYVYLYATGVQAWKGPARSIVWVMSAYVVVKIMIDSSPAAVFAAPPRAKPALW